MLSALHFRPSVILSEAKDLSRNASSTRSSFSLVPAGADA